MEENIIKEDIGFPNIQEALTADLFERMKWYQNQEDEFCVIDRVNTFYFHYIFKDALYAYDSNVLLCERIFKKGKCEITKVPSVNLSDKQKDLINEFIEFSDKLPKAEELSEKETKEITDKINYYQDKIKSDAVPTTEEKDMVSYRDNSTSQLYLLTELNSVPEESLKYVSSLISNFIIIYFSTMSYSIDITKLDIKGIEYDDYIDIVIILK